MVRTIPISVVLVTLFALTPLSLGQGSINTTGTSNCSAADFEDGVHFRNDPGDYYTIIIDKRNISTHRCVFDGTVYGPSFVIDQKEGQKPPLLDYFPETRLPNGFQPLVPPLTLESGQVARQTFRWRTRPSNESVPCVQPKWMSHPILLNVPSILKRICSAVEVSRFSLAPSSQETWSALGEVDHSVTLHLTSDREKYYLGEDFLVRLSQIRRAVSTFMTDDCLTLYVSVRSPTGETRIDEQRPLLRGCVTPGKPLQPVDWDSGLELDSGVNSRWGGLGEHAIRVFHLAVPPDAAQLKFHASNLVTIRLADPASIQRTWGARTKGIAADISLDKHRFRLGEDVPLHIAIQNFDAAVPIYSADPVWDPCSLIQIEVRDARGRTLAPEERVMAHSVCMGHGFGPKLYPKGKIVPLERSLKRARWLPKRPGSYSIVVTWAPSTSAPNDSSASSASITPLTLVPYAVAEANSTIEIVESEP